MIEVPPATPKGKFFYSYDTARDYGIYQAVKRRDITYNYVRSAESLAEASTLCKRLNDGSVTLQQLWDEDTRREIEMANAEDLERRIKKREEDKDW